MSVFQQPVRYLHLLCLDGGLGVNGNLNIRASPIFICFHP
jgi:hypothetical protein